MNASTEWITVICEDVQDFALVLRHADGSIDSCPNCGELHQSLTV